MCDPFLIYGATGYTGQLVAAEALRHGLRPVLCGRSAERLAAIAEGSGLACRVARVEQAGELDRALRDVRVVVNAAGPFAETAQPVLEACLRAGAHYLDISGEPLVFATLAHRDTAARRRGIMVMPGVGFDVVPSDCLAAHVARRLPGADRLAIGIKGLVQATRGSIKTMASYAGTAAMVRRQGRLTPVTQGAQERSFDFGQGPERCLCVVWGDVFTAFYTTGIGNIEVYFDAAPWREMLAIADRSFGRFFQLPIWQTWLRTLPDFLPETSALARVDDTLVIVSEASDGRGRRAVARLRTPEAYTLTAMTAAAIAARALSGDVEVGWQTPGRVFGPDFILAFPGVQREDLT